MGYCNATVDGVESVMDDGYGAMWLLKDALDTDHLGVTVLELEPGAVGKEHDHAEDDQEEAYVAVEGSVEVTFGDESVTLDTLSAVRVDPDQTRWIRRFTHASDSR